MNIFTKKKSKKKTKLKDIGHVTSGAITAMVGTAMVVQTSNMIKGI